MDRSESSSPVEDLPTVSTSVVIASLFWQFLWRKMKPLSKKLLPFKRERGKKEEYRLLMMAEIIPKSWYFIETAPLTVNQRNRWVNRIGLRVNIYLWSGSNICPLFSKIVVGTRKGSGRRLRMSMSRSPAKDWVGPFKESSFLVLQQLRICFLSLTLLHL